MLTPGVVTADDKRVCARITDQKITFPNMCRFEVAKCKNPSCHRANMCRLESFGGCRPEGKLDLLFSVYYIKVCKV